MNFERDFEAFSEMLDELWEMKGAAPLGSGARTGFFRTLEPWPLREVEYGIEAHKADPERGRFLPMPADIIAQIKIRVADDGRPGPEEAWATAVRGRDESETIVWTDETAEAMGIAKPLLQAGDDVGARMAFKESYTRLVDAAREKRKPPAWGVSKGFDNERYALVVAEHVALGHLSKAWLEDAAPVKQIGLDALLALPAPKNSTPENLAAREAARENLRRLRDEMASGRQSGPSKADIERERIEGLKAETQKRVDEYQRG